MFPFLPAFIQGKRHLLLFPVLLWRHRVTSHTMTGVGVLWYNMIKWFSAVKLMKDHALPLFLISTTCLWKNQKISKRTENQLCIKAIFSSFTSEGGCKSLNHLLLCCFKKGVWWGNGKDIWPMRNITLEQKKIFSKWPPCLASDRIFVPGE